LLLDTFFYQESVNFWKVRDQVIPRYVPYS